VFFLRGSRLSFLRGGTAVGGLDSLSGICGYCHGPGS